MASYILGIETSCDDTAAAVLEDGALVRSSIVATQAEVHGPYGGIVPELASRRHVETILPVVARALREAGVELGDLAGIAVTVGPGLVGSLLVGLSAAKAMAFVRGLPLVGVNHLEGHIAAARLDHPGLEPPFVALIVSGGHTHLYAAAAWGRYRLLGRTRDDAAGEAFDKVAGLLGLGFPGGPPIERAAREGNPDAIVFPRAVFSDGGLDFSFSGLKTAVVHHLRGLGWDGVRRPAPIPPAQVADIAAGFQAAVADMLARNTLRAARAARAPRVVVAGGVACNEALRHRLAAAAAEWGQELFIPRPALCTDNAAMIAAAGARRLGEGERAGLELNADPNLPLHNQ
jgi:N6-L-threonylcarbamoyladenine synthase